MSSKELAFLILLLYGYYLYIYHLDVHPELPVETAVKNLKTGDLIFGTGESGDIKQLIQLVGWGYRYSHIGVIYKDKKGRLWMCHATNESCDTSTRKKNVIYGTPCLSACMPFDLFLKTWVGRLSVRFLRKPLNDRETEKFEQAVSQENGKPFPNKWKCLWGSWYDHRDAPQCAQYTARVLKRVGLLKEHLDPDAFVPIHFLNDNAFNERRHSGLFDLKVN